MLDEALQKVAVIGAAGKMGKGIAILLLQEMARLEAEKRGKVGTREYRLTLVDASEEGLQALKHTLRQQLMRYAEKQINPLRRYFVERPNLVSNEEIIDTFVTEGMDLVRYAVSLEAITGTHLIFEAIVEDPEQKVRLFQQLKQQGNDSAYFLSNTSSIPIGWLNEKAGLDNRIVGFHFYNPPEAQKVVEFVTLKNTPAELRAGAQELGQRLRKTLVPSHDVAGFIGNGLLIRELLFALDQLEQLGCPLPEALTLINDVTQRALLRPMGIFQLIDYVGIDVIKNISTIMTEHLPGTFKHPLIESMCEKGIFGGQYPDGTPKPGFFQYEKGLPTGVYTGKMYVPYITEEGFSLSWKQLKRDPNKQEKIAAHFTTLAADDTLTATLALEFLKQTQETAQLLVETKVVDSIDSINTVLIEGFHHLYGVEHAHIP